MTGLLRGRARENEGSLPPQLLAAFDGETALLRWTLELSASTIKEIGLWVLQPVSAEACRRRAEHLAERLLSVMEAERELPGFLMQALKENARAARGWSSMTVLQRRGLLMALYRPRGIEARRYQLERLLDAAERRGAKADD